MADVRRDKLAHMGGRHSLRTAGWIGARMLDILEGMHAKGRVSTPRCQIGMHVDHTLAVIK